MKKRHQRQRPLHRWKGMDHEQIVDDAEVDPNFGPFREACEKKGLDFREVMREVLDWAKDQTESRITSLPSTLVEHFGMPADALDDASHHAGRLANAD